jgi:hypothetical protein
MRHQVKHFKSAAIALKELEPFIRNGRHLQTGKPFTGFNSGRSRELLANWLLCEAVNSLHEPGRLVFTSDPVGGDGVIYDTQTGETWPTEHIIVPEQAGGATADVEALILEAIARKRDKGGEPYASGKTLVVFQNAAGQPWFPNTVARKLPAPLYFEAVWVVGLQGIEDGKYIYQVTRLDLRQGNAPAWRVTISAGFDSWTVQPIQ